MIRVGVVGFGYWGPNIARNFYANSKCELANIADVSEFRQKAAARKHPNVRIVSKAEEIIAASDIDAVAVVTPVHTHYSLVKQALLNGKHVLVAKPLTADLAQAKELAELAEKQNLVLMIDNTFLFTGAVQKIKSLIDDDALGSLYYFDSVRINLGLFQHDVNVVWDLTPHDISILFHLLNLRPTGVCATGARHFDNDMEDMAYLTLFYPNNFIAHFHVNWLSPIKVRKTIIGGSKKMLVWDDLNQEEKVKIYDKGVEVTSLEGKYRLLAEYRMGGVNTPALSTKEALAGEVEHFIDCIESNKSPLNDAKTGAEIVALLEAVNKSLCSKGEIVELN